MLCRRIWLRRRAVLKLGNAVGEDSYTASKLYCVIRSLLWVLCWPITGSQINRSIEAFFSTWSSTVLCLDHILGKRVRNETALDDWPANGRKSFVSNLSLHIHSSLSLMTDSQQVGLCIADKDRLDWSGFLMLVNPMLIHNLITKIDTGDELLSTSKQAGTHNKQWLSFQHNC